MEAQNFLNNDEDDIYDAVRKYREDHPIKTEVTMQSLFNLLTENGGAIISSNDLHPHLIEQARASNRMYVDENSFGFVWEPPIAGRFPETEDEIEMFEWCYPLPVELPEEVNNPEWIFKKMASNNINKPVDRDRAIFLLNELLERPDILLDAIQNESTNWNAESLLDFAESCTPSKDGGL